MFISSLYSGYGAGKPSPNLTGPQAAKIFTASTLALIRKDQQLAKGQVGVLDYDPICDCQDDADIQNVSVSESSATSQRAKVVAKFKNGRRKVSVVFDLVLEGGEWKIYDVHGSLGGSLRKLLESG
jgi:hypothetical protein